MLAFVTTPAGGTGAIAADQITGDVGATYVWRCTERDRLNGVSNDSNSSATRSSDNVYMRGLKEYITITTTTGATWFWRRICITTKGIPFYNTAFSAVTGIETTTNGWVRVLANLRKGSTWGPSRNAVNTLLFKGEASIDWIDPHNAKVDTQRCTIKHDRQRVLRSGNNLGTCHLDKTWYPMNARLVYNNDETGENETGNTSAAVGNAGMGDYYVIDYIDCINGTSSDILYFLPQATLYWHER